MHPNLFWLYLLIHCAAPRLHLFICLYPCRDYKVLSNTRADREHSVNNKHPAPSLTLQ